jgi:hypothetical protein
MAPGMNRIADRESAASAALSQQRSGNKLAPDRATAD